MTRIRHAIAIFTLLGSLVTVTAAAQTVVKVGRKKTVLSATLRAKVRLGYFPDSTMEGFADGGTTYIFAANGGARNTQGLTTVDLNDLRHNGFLIPTTRNIPPGGPNDFDRNYGGGAAVYYDKASGILIHMYHGEFWYRGRSNGPFYAALGLAYSTDLGATWNKLGEVISPHATRTGECQVDTGVGTLVPAPDGYLYTYYDDVQSGCDQREFNVAVARARISDVITAAQSGSPFTSGPGTLFEKYYNGAFTENGVTDLANPQNGGGDFTPLLTGGVAWVPDVVWNGYLDEFVMAYAAAWKGIDIRFSTDGIAWGPAKRIVKGGHPPPDAVFYPSLLNADGGDPAAIGQQFYLYYVDSFGDWSQSDLKRTQITVSAAAPTLPQIPGSAGH